MYLPPDSPAPYGPVPDARQLAWHELEFFGFLHFTVNTFTDLEWGYGDESPEIFNPTEFDADQIVLVAKDAGMKGLILTAKHHDGFCLWPSPYTEHCIRNSPFRDGKGDVVREICDACARHGLKFGLYLSPWDRNHAQYAGPEYVEYYHAQMREILTNYGPLFEVWLDGANGGDGYYGGARETRTLPNSDYYQLDKIIEMVRELQPDAVIFSNVDIRWVGNEEGYAKDPCWSTYDPTGSFNENGDQDAMTGHRGRGVWMPAEADTSIRPGWFYHAHEDDKVKTPEKLMETWYATIGRNCAMLLNLPPDRRGLVHENDVASLQGFRKRLDAMLAIDYAKIATVTADNERGVEFTVANLIDGSRETFWATDDDVLTTAITLTLSEPALLNAIMLREPVWLGQRIDEVEIDALVGDKWITVKQAEGVGTHRVLQFDAITTTAIRVRITKAAASPALTQIGLFYDAG